MELLRRRREQIEARETRAPGEMPIATCLDRLEHDGTTACFTSRGFVGLAACAGPSNEKREGNGRPCRG